MAKKNSLYVFLLGSLLTLGFAPFHFWITIFSYIVLLLILENKTAQQSFLLGWLFGLGHFTTSLYWIANALLVPPAPFKWAVPFAIFGLPVFIALFPAFCCWMYKKLKPNTSFQPLVFSTLWVVTELMRSFFFTGFPWNLMGYVWHGPALQGAYIFTIWGLSLFTMLFATSGWLVIKKEYRTAVIYILPIIFLATYGQLRLAKTPIEYTEKTVRIVQPNIPQQDKWNRKLGPAHVNKMLRLSYHTPAPLNAIIWPEAALRYTLSTNPLLRQHITKYLDKNTFLITGAIEKKGGQFTNSVIALNNKGNIIAQYDKYHLVPFGEYIPFQDYLPLKPLAEKLGKVSAGKSPTTMRLNDFPVFQPLICYEVIFPEITLSQKSQLLINVTNDAWYGDSTGPHQHLQIARVRAIESGTPLIRVANTGISAAFDALGRELVRIPLNKEGFVDVKIPKAK